MQQLKRFLAIIVMVISVLMLVISLVGIIGVWAIRPRITASLEEVAARAEIRVTNVKEGLDQLETGLADAQNQVAEMEGNLEAIGEDLEQNKTLVTAVTGGLESKLATFLETAGEIAVTILEGIAALNSTVETLNALPFISMPTAEFERIETLAQSFEDLQTQVQELQTTIDQRRTEIIQGTVAIVTEPLSRISSRLDTLQSRISGYSEALAAIQAGLEEFETSIGRWLTFAAIFITLILLWLALSQAGLLVLGWRFYSGQDLLADDSKMPTTISDSTDSEEDTDIESE